MKGDLRQLDALELSPSNAQYPRLIDRIHIFLMNIFLLFNIRPSDISCQSISIGKFVYYFKKEKTINVDAQMEQSFTSFKQAGQVVFRK